MLLNKSILSLFSDIDILKAISLSKSETLAKCLLHSD